MTTDGRRPAAPTRKRRRASKRALRIGAWVAGVASFLGTWGVLGVAPRPQAAPPAPAPAPQVIIRRVVRHVQAKGTVAAPKIRYVYAPSAPAAASTGGSRPAP